MTLTEPRRFHEQEATPVARGWWGLVLVAGLLGIVGAVWQTAERMSTLSAGGGKPICEVNSVVSCQTAYAYWQSSALGIPNSLIGLPVFAIIASAAVAALLGSRHTNSYLVGVWALALFMTAFAFWYMEQSAFEMRALCLFCTASMVNILLASVGLTRVLAGHHALGEGSAGQVLAAMVERRVDLLLWAGVALAVAVMLYAGLAP